MTLDIPVSLNHLHYEAHFLLSMYPVKSRAQYRHEDATVPCKDFTEIQPCYLIYA